MASAPWSSPTASSPARNFGSGCATITAAHSSPSPSHNSSPEPALGAHRGRAVAGSLALGALLLPGCARLPEPPKQPSAAWVNPEQSYRISPGAPLSVFVWQDPALSLTAHVRPDGRVTIPLVQDVPAAGRTPAELGHDLTDRLKAYVRDPVVTVSVADPAGPLEQQVRIIGQAAKPM